MGHGTCTEPIFPHGFHVQNQFNHMESMHGTNFLTWNLCTEPNSWHGIHACYQFSDMESMHGTNFLTWNQCIEPISWHGIYARNQFPDMESMHGTNFKSFIFLSIFKVKFCFSSRSSYSSHDVFIHAKKAPTNLVRQSR